VDISQFAVFFAQDQLAGCRLKFHGHVVTPLEYAISLIYWSFGCICWPKRIYLTLTTLHHLKIPLLLIKKGSK